MTDLMQQARELLPCPFCGCAATLRIGERMLVDAHVICEGCSAEGPGFGADATEGDFTMEALEAWNRRAAPEGFVMVPVEPTDEMIEASLIRVPIAKRINPGQHLRIYGARAWDAMLAARPQGVKDV